MAQRRLSGRGGIGTMDIDRASISKKLNKTVQKYAYQVKLLGPKVLRESISSALRISPKTRNLADLPKRWKVETRGRENKRVSGGIFAKVIDYQFTTKVILTPTMLGAAYWPLMTAQYGRKALPKRPAGDPYPLAMPFDKIDEDYLAKHPKWGWVTYSGKTSHSSWRGKTMGVVFTLGPISAIAPTNQWIDRAHEYAASKFKKEIAKLARKKK